MANWTNRLVIGAAVVMMAPVTARLALPSGGAGETAAEGPKVYQSAASHGAGVQQPKANQSSPTDQLLSIESAEQIAQDDSEHEFRTTMCDFLLAYGASTPVANKRICKPPADGAVEAMIAILPDPVHTHLALRFDRAVDDLQNTALQLGWLFHRAWLPWGELQEGGSELRFQERAVDEAMAKKREEWPGLILFRRGTANKPLLVLVVGDTPTAGVNTAQFSAAMRIWWDLKSGLPACGTDCRGDTKRRLMLLGPTFTGSADSLQMLLQSNMEELTRHGHKCPAGRMSVSMASGTMTSGDKLSALASSVSLSPSCPIAVDPVSFAEDSSYQRSYLLRFLDQRLANTKSQVAELSEEESGFGAQMMEQAPEGTRNRLKLETELVKQQFHEAETAFKAATDSKEHDQGSCSSVKEDAKKKRCLGEVDAHVAALSKEKTRLQLLGDELGDEVKRKENLEAFFREFQQKRGDLQLKFPRGISLLRQAYEQSGILGFGGGAGSAPRTELKLDLQEETRDDDAVTEFAGSQSAVSMESRMAQLAATLEQSRIAVAVLSATDVLDDIFVARYLQAHAPGVTVVIQDADVLFLRGGSEASMDGVYVVSPYPLIPESANWSHDNENPLPHLRTLPPSQGDKGTENAVRYLLCGGGETNFELSSMCGWKDRADFDGQYLWMNEYEPPFPVGPASANDFKLQPPLWLSVIGHGGFQPVSLIDVDQQDADFPESSLYNLPRLGTVVQGGGKLETPVTWTHPAGIADPPLGQIYICTLALAFLLGIHGWAVCRCRLNRQFFWSYAAADVEPWATRLMVQVGLGLLGIYGLSLVLLHDQAGLQMEAPWFKGWVIFAQAATAAVNGVAAWRASADGRHTARQGWAAGIMLLVSGLFVWAADQWLWQMFAPPVEKFSERNFFIYRSAYPLNGASPLLPMLLLLAAGALWMWGRLSKMVFFGCRIPKLPSKGVEVRCPCGEWTKSLEQLLGQPLWRLQARKINGIKLGIGMIAAALVCAVVGLTGQWGPHSLAYTGFDALVDTLALLVAVGVVHNLLVSFVAWRMLKHEVLMPLKQSPLRWGFNWIQGFSWKRLWTSPGGFSPEAQLEFVMRNVEAERRGDAALKAAMEIAAGRPAPGADVLDAFAELNQKYEAWQTHVGSCPTRWERAACGVQWADDVAKLLQKLYTALSDEADEKLTGLKRLWEKDHGPLTGPKNERGWANCEDPCEAKTPADRADKLQRTGDEEFVAMVYLTYIRSVLVQIRNRIGTAAGLYILLLLSLTGYPWMNRHGILLQMSALLVLLAVASILIYGEMQKDDILSRTTETKEGKLDGEFFSKILSVVGVPLLTLIATQFPEFSNAIFSWLMPGLSNVK